MDTLGIGLRGLLTAFTWNGRIRVISFVQISANQYKNNVIDTIAPATSSLHLEDFPIL